MPASSTGEIAAPPPPPRDESRRASSFARLRAWGGGRLPRIETALLLLALAWTLAAKFLVIRQQAPDDLLTTVTEAVLPDFAFFAAAWLVLSLLLLIRRPGLVGRLTLLLSAVALGWAMANAAWLIATRVQLQPSVLRVLLRDPGEFWPSVEAHLVGRPRYSVPILLTLGAGAAWLCFRLIRPTRATRSRRFLINCSAAALCVLLVTSAIHWANVRGGRLAYSGEVLGFSSHWYALLWSMSEVAPNNDVRGGSRVVARSGERMVTWPPSPESPPNVVVVFLESVSRDATSLGEVGRSTTPFLAQLASEGVEFVTTRAPVPQTSKAWWATLTGLVPDLEPDYVEAVPMDRPYESLATLLGGQGYRSAFFQMSRGSFECAPGLFWNLGFDWAWFRENLEDESSHLGYMNGDDFRMFDPMFAWVDDVDGPFLLTMINSVSHDPYELPDWYEHEPADDPFGEYLQTLRFTDDWMAELCRQLQSRGLLENTLLCVIGDHGEGFRPEGGLGRWTPFEEVIRVPWVIRWPDRVEGGRRIEWPCSQLDVLPTILSLLGAEIGGAGFDGRNAMQPAASDRRLYFSSWYKQSPLGYVEADRKLVYWPYTDALFEYDLSSDPAEKSPRTLKAGPEKTGVVDALEEWRRGHTIMVPARRFHESVAFERWRMMSSGRFAWAHYEP